MSNLAEKFKAVKKHDWSKAAVSLYVAKRRLVQRSARYTVLEVKADETLRSKLRSIAVAKIEYANQATSYDYNTADQDNDFLGINTAETDLPILINSITGDPSPEQAEKYEDLVGSWLYIARLDLPDHPPLFSVRRVSEGWTAKKVKNVANVIFKGDMLVDLKDEEIFRIDGKLDFFSFDGMLFIANKKNFEAALNFREGMINNRDVIVEEFKKTKLFVNADDISRLVGDNMKRLRKLSQIKKSGYYLDQGFLANLKKVSKSEGWEISYAADGRLEVTEDDIEIVLRVLNNDRLTSKINAENFDVDVKHKLSGE